MVFDSRSADEFGQSVNSLYIISYDYTLEKVVKYTHVPLDTIAGISKGKI